MITNCTKHHHHHIHEKLQVTHQFHDRGLKPVGTGGGSYHSQHTGCPGGRVKRDPTVTTVVVRPWWSKGLQLKAIKLASSRGEGSIIKFDVEVLV